MSKEPKKDPLSNEFDANVMFQSEKLNLPGVHVEEIEAFENLEDVRDHIHSTKYNVEQVDVIGPGGVPLRKACPVAVQGRLFTEDQGTIQGNRKVFRNVLTRMDDMKGPLAVLRRCKESQTRVKVYTRNHVKIRGIITGLVVAFDKQWNIVLKECEEVFIKKIRNKAPNFGDVSKVVSICDLSIKADDFDESAYQSSPLFAPRLRSTIPSYKWPNPFREKTTKIDSRSENYTSSSNTTIGWKIDSKVISPNFTTDVNFLRQTREIEESTSFKEKQAKPRRRRRKEEIRFRKVKQILIRGEMIVIVSVCSEST